MSSFLFRVEYKKPFSMDIAELLKTFQIIPFSPHLEIVIELFRQVCRLFSLILILKCKRWKLVK